MPRTRGKKHRDRWFRLAGSITGGCPVRHPSRKNLRDLVDVFIDDHNPFGDTVLKLNGMEHAIAPISTITDGYIVRRIEIAAVSRME